MKSRFPVMLVLWFGREFYREYRRNGAIDQYLLKTLATLSTKCSISKILEFSRYLYLEPISGFLQMIPCDVNPIGESINSAVLGSQGSIESSLDFERVDRLGSSLEWYPQCELLQLYESVVANMECRFPAMLVLWLGREFYREYRRNGAIDPRPWRPFWQLVDKSGVFGDKMYHLKNTRIFSISLLGAEIRICIDNSM
ncbi:hypothetical protein AVEN_188560-1 [Araneus ventricosus]|uniref:Uncharacterized protein n=1 Tax=Araneus ventricosus TaxID=182803 RepID=A0A4Y2LVL9_ARAVE|nr:hypothetical protein AVEN_188560-1 [Araneus ventricosus]